MEVRLTYQFLPDGDAMRLWTWVDYYGIALASDSRLAAPMADTPEDLMGTISFTAADMSKRGRAAQSAP
jgi:type IV pilus biogenesis protein CpaD/CtpE